MNAASWAAGEEDSAHGCYVMHWPGLLVLFPVAPQQADSWQGGACPPALPHGSAPVASRLCIHAGPAGIAIPITAGLLL